MTIENHFFSPFFREIVMLLLGNRVVIKIPCGKVDIVQWILHLHNCQIYIIFVV